MAKRKPLAFNNNQLTEDLKESAGRGVDAFFSSPTPLPTLETKTIPLSKPEANKEESLAQPKPTVKDQIESLQVNKQVSKLASKQAYLQSILELKATNTATFRFPPELLDKLEEVHYSTR